MANDQKTIDYAGFVDAAMRGVVKDILRQVERTGLPGQHHFFVSFRTDYPGVTISETLKSKYPQEITIVLQHQFWDMRVEADHFKVALSFNNIPEKLSVPYLALTGFADPSTKFGLQFHSNYEGDPEPQLGADDIVLLTDASSSTEPKESAKILTLDAFRKK